MHTFRAPAGMARITLAFACAAVCIGCPGAYSSRTEHGPAAPASQQETLTLGPLSVPCTSIWTGSAVDAMVADAMASCAIANTWIDSAYGGSGSTVDRAGADLYEQHLLNLIDATIEDYVHSPDPPVNALYSWAVARTLGSDFSCDPATGEKGTVRLSKVPEAIAEWIEIPSSRPGWAADIDDDSWKDVFVRANSALRRAARNLCTAEVLRVQSPGSSGQSALFLSDADQRQLLETIRERTQIAMLQYAALGVTFQHYSTHAWNMPPLRPGQIAPILSDWALASDSDPQRATTMEAMGRDFAAAVELHGMVTEELTALMARARSAGDPIGAKQSVDEKAWGPGSWFQRLMALGYGGDPFAGDPATLRGLGLAGPGTGASFANTAAWPSGEDNHLIATDIARPGVQQLLRYAGAKGVLQLKLAAAGTQCPAFDTLGSSDELYRAAEAQLRVDVCAAHRTDGSCETDPSNVMPPAWANESGFELYTRLGIRRTDAETIARFVASAIGVDQAAVCSTSAWTDYRWQTPPGALTLVGVARFDQSMEHLVFDPGAKFESRGLNALAPLYTRYSTGWIADAVDFGWNADGASVGVDYECTAEGCLSGQLESQRTMGALSAEAAVRRALIATAEWSGSSSMHAGIAKFFAHRDAIVDVIDAAIGHAEVDIRPSLDACPTAEFDGVGLCVTSKSSGTHDWRVEVTPTEDDPAWSFLCSSRAPDCTVTHRLAFVTGPFAESIAAASGQTSWFGNGVASLVAAAEQRGEVATFSPTGTVRPRYAAVLPLGDAGSAGTRYGTLLHERSESSSGSSKRYQLLASRVAIPTTCGNCAHYLPFGGRLGTVLADQARHAAANPREHAVDGFGYPAHWVPPFDGRLVGGAPGTRSLDVLIDTADKAATAAADAVSTALTDLAGAWTDESQAEAATARASAAVQDAASGLCGPSNPNCDTTGMDWMFPESLLPSVEEDCAEDEQANYPVACQVRLIAKAHRDQIAGMHVRLASAVVSRISESIPPTFSDYQGGTLQARLVAEWGAVRRASDALGALSGVCRSGAEAIRGAYAAMQGLEAEVLDNCNPVAFHNAMTAGASRSTSSGMSFPPSISSGAGESFSMAPILAQVQKCKDLATQLPASQASIVTAQSNAWSAVASATQQFDDALSALAEAAAACDSDANQARLASYRGVLEEQLARAGLKSSFGVLRRFTDADVVRARALLEGARRFALAARRSVEAEYVVDLAGLAADEPFVAAPSSWADGIYGYDLSLPAAVGLTPTGGSTGALTPNAVTDYVANLKAFRAGFAVARPTAVAAETIKVVVLPGMTDDSGGVIGPWQVHCVGQPDDAWAPLPNGEQAGWCLGGRPDGARLAFALDPWGRAVDSVATSNDEKRYNARWEQLAVNLVGTAIIECDGSPDPLVCYAEETVPYDLVQVSDPWVTDWTGAWRSMALGPGRIAMADALAAERWLDPLKDGWSTSYVGAIARTELADRPLGGAYVIELHAGPDVRLDRIERLQLMVGARAWVRQ